MNQVAELADDDEDAEGVPQPFQLMLVSYGHAHGPLTKAPDSHQLLFSVRDIPNPPAQLRKRHTGLSSRLRKEVLASREAAKRLDSITESIQEAMLELETKWQAQPGSDPPTNGAEALNTTQPYPQLLQVGICCEEGRHRSVSFVHELARSKRLKRQRWCVSCAHRDLGQASDEADDESSNAAKPKRQHAQERKKGRSRKTVIGVVDESD